MIRANRSRAVPASLNGPAAEAEKKAAALYYATWQPGTAAFGKFEAYSGNDVIDALRKMFHGKCAYCEGDIEKGTREVEHYRPKGGVEDPQHPGYWWLAHSWDNLLPTCGPCNKGLKQHLVTAEMTVDDVEALQAKPAAKLAGKANSFPVGAARLVAGSEDHAAEQPRLINPTRSDPNDYLRWSHVSDFSILAPRSEAGQPAIEGTETIRCLALNRVGLVEARTKQLNILRTQRIRILERLEEARALPETAQESALRFILCSVEDMKLHCAADKEFAAMATAFVATFREELGAWLKANAHSAILADA